MMENVLDLEVIASIKEISALHGKSGFARDFYRLFSELSEQTTHDLAVAAAKLDFKSVRQLAHRLKGSAAIIGAIKLSQQFEAIEHLAELPDCDTEKLSRAIGDIGPLREQSLLALSHALLTDPS